MPQTMPPAASPAQLENIGAIAAAMVEDSQVVGLGSGRAAQAFVRQLGRRIAQGGLQMMGIPTSLATARVARTANVPLTTLENVARADIAVDGADEVDPQLNLLKGGGGDLLREKVVASISRKLIIVVGQEKLVPRLGMRFPVFIEVVRFAMPTVIRALVEMGATATPRRNADQTLFLTDNGNPLVHAYLSPHPGAPGLENPARLEERLAGIPGVIETGLFLGMADEVLVARFDGMIDHLLRAK